MQLISSLNERCNDVSFMMTLETRDVIMVDFPHNVFQFHLILKKYKFL